MEKNQSLLIVEDDKDISQVLFEILSPHFGEIFCTDDGIKGLELLRKKRPSLILTDISLPGLSGIEMIQKARAEGIDAPVIFQTAHDDKDIMLSALRLGACDFISKPFQIQEVLKTVERVRYTEEKKEKVKSLLTENADPDTVKKEMRMIGLLQAASVKKAS